MDVGKNGTVELNEFLKFMMKTSVHVSKAFVSFPPPPVGPESAGGWGGDGDDPFEPSPEGRPAWAVPMSRAEAVKDIRTWKRIGGFTSLATTGVHLTPNPAQRLPNAPPFPSVDEVLRRGIAADVKFKEKAEDTSWDLHGPRYQVTARPLEGYHAGRVWGGDGFYCATRFGGVRPRHEAVVLLKGQPNSADEALFQRQKGLSNCREPLFLEPLDPETGVFERLSSLTTSSRLQHRAALLEDRGRLQKLHGKKTGSAPGYVPL